MEEEEEEMATSGDQPFGQADTTTQLEAWARSLDSRPELQESKVILGEWRPEVKLTRVTQARGKMLTTMGITFDKANHLLPEETLFLLERAYLIVKNVTRDELYAMVGVPAYLTYAYYKKLGYAVLRASPEVPPHVPTHQGDSLSISYRLFPPNARFSKRDPGTPTSLVAIARDRFGIPTRQQMEELVAKSTSTPTTGSITEPDPVLHVALVSDDGGVFPFEIRANVPAVPPQS